ncbi:BRO family protein [Arsenophonus sp.]|uniref:BRO-N domain-containing protein n=2 Tax=Arsenophonus sp. TaxID=1872640 RepID=UPI002858E9E0|nr:BRO family protein [Arsenophonus sp.]MDR5616249.1 BRO family protein [Arsenophonus sp.]MDR5617390.1 BRO family protein [Arsenophonus sp.]MDR5618402.1 BRO family protein [Arsenophonus sp.]
MTTTQAISFSFQETHNVRIQIIDRELWFCLRDVCDVLSIVNSRRVTAEILDLKGVRKTDTLTKGGNQQLVYVNEPNLYRVIFRSNKPEAKQFQDWVFNEVLPSIRKTGRYDRHQTQPQTKASERFSHSDTRNLTHLVWCMTNGFRFERSWSNAVWLALREVTGTPSPERFQVAHIPLMADECRRIYYITESLRQIINDAEKQTIKRILRKRENIDTVLAEIKQLFEQFHHQQMGIITARTDQWYEGELTHFLERH